MRKAIFLTSMLFMACISNAQSFSINTDGSIADTSAILDVKSIAKGILIPRMLKTQRTTIFQPAAGLLVYQNAPDSTGFYYYNGSKWLWLVSFETLQAADTAAWKRQGNAGTDPAVNFVGTTDNQPLHFRVNNTKAGSIDQIKRSTSFGILSLANNTALYNVAIGDSALMNNTIYSQLTAVGFSAMKKNAGGLYNTAVGAESLLQNIVGTHNTATGYLSLRNNTASFNTSMGTLALYSNSTGIRNTGVGCSSMYFNNGNDNVAVGYESLNQNFSGSRNVVIGSNAMRQNFSGSQNIAMGDSSLFNNLFGSNNIAIGKNALFRNSNKDYIIAIGDSALYNNGNSTTAIQSVRNTAIGSKALYTNTTGYGNTAVGYNALRGNLSGTNNVAFGDQSMQNNLAGNNNTALGVNAGINNISGENVTALGYNANPLSGVLTNSTALGAGAKIGTSNAVSIGDSTLGTTVGIGTAYPTQAGLVVNQTVGGFTHAMFGSYTTGVAIESNWPGIGFNSYNNGSRRFIANGYAGRISLDPASGNMWLLVDGTGTAGSTIPYEKGVVIRDGAGATGSFTPFVDNVTSLGLPGARWTTIYATNAVISTSDAREKKNIAPLGYGLKQVLQLKPVMYQWKNPDAGGQVMLGLLAQDVKKILPEVIEENNGTYGMRSAEIIPVLVKAIQEQQSIIEILRKQVEAAKADIPMQIGKQQSVIDQQQKLLEQVMKRLEQVEKRN